MLNIQLHLCIRLMVNFIVIFRLRSIIVSHELLEEQPAALLLREISGACFDAKPRGIEATCIVSVW